MILNEKSDPWPQPSKSELWLSPHSTIHSDDTTFIITIITTHRINPRVTDILHPLLTLAYLSLAYSGLLSIPAKVGRAVGEAGIKEFLLLIGLHKYFHP